MRCDGPVGRMCKALRVAEERGDDVEESLTGAPTVPFS